MFEGVAEEEIALAVSAASVRVDVQMTIRSAEVASSVQVMLTASDAPEVLSEALGTAVEAIEAPIVTEEAYQRVPFEGANFVDFTRSQGIWIGRIATYGSLFAMLEAALLGDAICVLPMWMALQRAVLISQLTGFPSHPAAARIGREMEWVLGRAHLTSHVLGTEDYGKLLQSIIDSIQQVQAQSD